MSQTIARIDSDAELMANAPSILDAASAKLSALCHGERWNMSIPVQDDDSDVPLGAAIRLARALHAERVAREPEIALLAELRRIMAIDHGTVLSEYMALNATAVERSGYVSIQVMRNWLVWNAIQIANRPKPCVGCGKPGVGGLCDDAGCIEWAYNSMPMSEKYGPRSTPTERREPSV